MDGCHNHMIYALTNALLIPKLLSLASRVEGTDLITLEKIIVNQIGREDARVFVYEKDREFRGFIFATVEVFEGEDSVFIQFCVVESSANEPGGVCNELLSKVRKWADERGVRFLYFMTRRNPEGFKRRYKFRHYAKVTKSNVNDQSGFPEKQKYQYHQTVLRRAV